MPVDPGPRPMYAIDIEPHDNDTNEEPLSFIATSVISDVTKNTEARTAGRDLHPRKSALLSVMAAVDGYFLISQLFAP